MSSAPGWLVIKGGFMDLGGLGAELLAASKQHIMLYYACSPVRPRVRWCHSELSL